MIKNKKLCDFYNIIKVLIVIIIIKYYIKIHSNKFIDLKDNL